MSLDQQSTAMHPLSIELILTNIFEHCDPGTINNCRLVNKLWHKVSLPIWTKSTPVLVIKGNELGNCGHCDSRIAVHHKFDIFSKLNTSSSTYYRYAGRLRAHNVHLSRFSISNGDSFFTWLENRGARWITRLHITNTWFHDLKSFQDVIYGKHMPNLKSISVQIDYTFSFDDGNNRSLELENDSQVIRRNPKMTYLRLIFRTWSSTPPKNTLVPVNWTTLFCHYPNLETLILTKTNDWITTLEEMLKGIKLYQEHTKKRCELARLEIETVDEQCRDKIPPSIGHLFLDVKLPLTKLILDLGMWTNELVIRDVLRAHAKTLRDLTLLRHPRAPLPLQASCVPYMEHLESLKIQWNVTFSNLSFLTSMPNLMFLKFLDHNETEDFFENIVRAVRVKDISKIALNQLTTFRCIYAFNAMPRDVRSLAFAMPYITSLEMPLNNKTFRVICREWRQLRELKVLGDQLNDEGLTGFVFEEGQDQECHETTWTRRYVGITKLKHLVSFRMGYDASREYLGNERVTNLTDISVFFGFLMMRRLFSLHLFVEGFSDEAMQCLQSNIVDLRINQLVAIESEYEDLLD